MTVLAERIKQVKRRINEAALRAGTNPEEITLIAVSKYIEVDILQEARKLGLNSFGENRVQAAEEKKVLLPDVNWHLIGPLQSNKVKKAINIFNFIHSIDQMKTLALISQEAILNEKRIPILLEVNVSGEETKHGFAPEDMEEVVRKAITLPGITVSGLMTMAPYVEDPQEVRWVFRKLKEIFVKIKKKFPTLAAWKYLSMGMSNDFEVAIEEGANMVRIGSAIFEDIQEDKT